MGGALVLIVIAVLYFIPTIVAVRRNHHQTGSIAVINVLLGWTFIGWAVALAMAFSAVKRPEPEPQSTAIGPHVSVQNKLRRELEETSAHRFSELDTYRGARDFLEQHGYQVNADSPDEIMVLAPDGHLQNF